VSILHVITGNFRRGPDTLRFPARVAPPPGFRGMVQLDPARCVGCATCAYVCPSAAVAVVEDDTHYEWCYDPGRCTFCGRCVDCCPTQALTLAADRPPVYTQPQAFGQTHRLAYPRCLECGRPAQPINDIVLARAFDEITDEVRSWSRLCARCRQRRYHPALIETTYPARSDDDEC
jgi:hydrogenase-4 component H